MKHDKLIFLLALLVCIQLSCKKFLEIAPPKDSLVQETIFQNDDVVTSALTGVYYNMALNGFAAGSSGSVTTICGLTADEFKSYNISLNEFYENQLSPTNGTLSNSLYQVPYQQIFAVNAVLEGLNSANGITPPVKSQLTGEALFLRAFIYFYLVNLYGPVPLQLTSDYRSTKDAPRATAAQIYQQILTDLKSAEQLLTDKYITVERVRPNLSAVQALLARTYLYAGDPENAEKYSSMVIAKTSSYELVELNDVFLKNSKEAIWQLMPPANGNTNEGFFFILLNTPSSVALNATFVQEAFERNDLRKQAWIGQFNNATGDYFYPLKYKIRSATIISEYSMVLRLAEQYLIRAEAKALQDNLSGSMADLDKIRLRAGLSPIASLFPGIDKPELLEAIQRERRTELFAEWGHRWLDLKRTEAGVKILAEVKKNWQPWDVYYPIPQVEIDRNKQITQNEGY